MARPNWDRVAASSGIATVVGLVVGFSMTGSAPNWNASGSVIAQKYASHHDSGLASVIVIGFALMALIWLAATLGSVVRGSGEHRLASIVVAGAVAFVSIFAIAGVIQWTLYYGSANGDPAITKTLFQMQSLAASLAFLPLALMVFATSVGAARAKIFPRWYAGLSGIAALVIVVVVGTVAHSGFFSPNGGYVLISLLVLAIWLVSTSIVLMTGQGVRKATPEATV
jgi:hypothetical protein